MLLTSKYYDLSSPAIFWKQSCDCFTFSRVMLMQVKPLKELIFNSHNITATMTSRQFQVMLDVLTNLLFARPPKYEICSYLLLGN